MRKLIKYSLIAGLGVATVASLASCSDESKYFVNYEVSVKEADNAETTYKFKIYNEKYGYSVEETNSSSNTTTGAATTTAAETTSSDAEQTEEEVDDSLAKKYAQELTEGRQAILAGFVSTSSTSKELSIPKTVDINGQSYTVTCLGGSAFIGAKDIVKITVPETVSIIESNAFSYCKGLQTLDYKGEIVSVGNTIYKNDNLIKEISYAGKTVVAGLMNGIKTLTTVNIPNAEKLEAKALNACPYLETVDLGTTATLKFIGAEALEGTSHAKIDYWGVGGTEKTAWPVNPFSGFVSGQYYTLDECGYTYTKVDTDSVKAPEEGVTYYKMDSDAEEDITIKTVNGLFADKVRIVGAANNENISAFVKKVSNYKSVEITYGA